MCWTELCLSFGLVWTYASNKVAVQKVVFKQMNKWTKKVFPLVAFVVKYACVSWFLPRQRLSCRKIFFMCAETFRLAPVSTRRRLFVSENRETMISLSKAIGWSTRKVMLACSIYCGGKRTRRVASWSRPEWFKQSGLLSADMCVQSMEQNQATTYG